MINSISRIVRYQAAILNGPHLLMLMVHDQASGKIFWLLPGGGREAGESEHACLRREVLEETHLDVRVERRLLDEPAIAGDTYQRLKTYACSIIRGEARPGIEPEIDTGEHATITAVGWFDLRDPQGWDPLALTDPITYPILQQLRSVLGFDGQ